MVHPFETLIKSARIESYQRPDQFSEIREGGRENLKIRLATNADSENIKNLVYSVLQEYSLAPDPQATDRDLDDIEGNYLNNNGYFIVVEDNGRLIACMGLFRVNADTCELRKMYALPVARGKGLGKTLMDRAITQARELGYSRMILETASPLKEAITLYRKYGFTPFQPTHLSCRCDQAFELALNNRESEI